jgi:hypothetical protein
VPEREREEARKTLRELLSVLQKLPRDLQELVRTRERKRDRNDGGGRYRRVVVDREENADPHAAQIEHRRQPGKVALVPGLHPRADAVVELHQVRLAEKVSHRELLCEVDEVRKRRAVELALPHENEGRTQLQNAPAHDVRELPLPGLGRQAGEVEIVLERKNARK